MQLWTDGQALVTAPAGAIADDRRRRRPSANAEKRRRKKRS